MLQLIEGFERFPVGTSSSALQKRWTTNQLQGSSFVGGRSGGFALQFEGDTFQTSVPSSSFYVIGFAFKNINLTSSVTLLNTKFGGSARAYVFLDPSTGVLTAGDALSGGSVTSSPSTIVADTWYYLELRVSLGDTVKVYLNESLLLTVSGVTIGEINTIIFGGQNSSGKKIVYDDIYVLDGFGSDNVDALGDMTVEGLRAAGVGTYSDWTPSNKNRMNFECVAYSNGPFVYSNTAGQLDTYIFQTSRRIKDGPIYGVNVGIEARNTDATSHEMAAVVVMGTTTAVAVTQDIASTNADWFDFLYDNNPTTSSPWQIDELTASEFGIKLT